MENVTNRYAAAILVDGHKVLLAKRSNSRIHYPGIWDFVGGHCERDETFENALSRELEEEIGIRVSKVAFLTEVNHPPEFLLQLFLVTKWEGEVINKDEKEHERIVWFTIHDAKQLEFINDHYVAALKLVESYQDSFFLK